MPCTSVHDACYIDARIYVALMSKQAPCPTTATPLSAQHSPASCPWCACCFLHRLAGRCSAARHHCTALQHNTAALCTSLPDAAVCTSHPGASPPPLHPAPLLTIARRPFFSSLTAISLLFMPAGSKGNWLMRPDCTATQKEGSHQSHADDSPEHWKADNGKSLT
jgi:hypothetical protein